MVEQLLINDDNYYVPDANQLVTEDDTPVDNFASEKQQRLLVGSLYSSKQQQTFLAAANVGIYHAYRQPAIVPDVFLSFDVEVPKNWWEKQNRCYMLWEFGKPPEVVIEIVSNKEGDLRGRRYFETSETWLEQVGLGVTLWEGEFEGRQDVWLRWCYQNGSVLATGDERAEQERQRAEQAEQRAQLLAERLRAMGVDPDTL